MTTYNVTIKFKVQRASEADCKKFNQQLGMIEVLEADGTRHAWAKDEQTAVDKIHDYMYDVLGYSDDFAITKEDD